MYGQIEAWRNKPIEGAHPYLYLDGIWLKRTWGGEVRKVALLVAISVNADGYREIVEICEGMQEEKESWVEFLRHLVSRGLSGVRLIVSDKCLGWWRRYTSACRMLTGSVASSISTGTSWPRCPGKRSLKSLRCSRPSRPRRASRPSRKRPRK